MPAQTVGFIGLGIMGGPMVANLIDAGYDVIGYNRSPEPVDELVERGGERDTSARNCDHRAVLRFNTAVIPVLEGGIERWSPTDDEPEKHVAAVAAGRL